MIKSCDEGSAGPETPKLCRGGCGMPGSTGPGDATQPGISPKQPRAFRTCSCPALRPPRPGRSPSWMECPASLEPLGSRAEEEKDQGTICDLTISLRPRGRDLDSLGIFQLTGPKPPGDWQSKFAISDKAAKRDSPITFACASLSRPSQVQPCFRCSGKTRTKFGVRGSKNTRFDVGAP